MVTLPPPTVLYVAWWEALMSQCAPSSVCPSSRTEMCLLCQSLLFSFGFRYTTIDPCSVVSHLFLAPCSGWLSLSPNMTFAWVLYNWGEALLFLSAAFVQSHMSHTWQHCMLIALSVWSSYMSPEGSNPAAGTTAAPMTQCWEVSSYLGAPCVPEGACPLEFWRQHQSQYPKLARLACRLLALPATAAHLLRLSRVGGRVANPAHSRLNGVTFENLMFIKCNQEVR